MENVYIIVANLFMILSLHFKFHHNRPSIIESTTKNISSHFLSGHRLPRSLKSRPSRAFYRETEKRATTNSFTLKQSDVAMALIRSDVSPSRDCATLEHVIITNGCQSTNRTVDAAASAADGGRRVIMLQLDGLHGKRRLVTTQD